jgi:hypothetical protein
MLEEPHGSSTVGEMKSQVRSQTFLSNELVVLIILNLLVVLGLIHALSYN